MSAPAMFTYRMHRTGGTLLVLAGLISVLLGIGLVLTPVSGLEARLPVSTEMVGGLAIIVGLVEGIGGRAAYRGRNWYGALAAGLIGLLNLATYPLTLAGLLLVGLSEGSFPGADGTFSGRTYRAGGVLLMLVGAINAAIGLGVLSEGTAGGIAGLSPFVAGALGGAVLVLGVVEFAGGWLAYRGRSWYAGMAAGLLGLLTRPIYVSPLQFMGTFLIGLGEGRMSGTGAPFTHRIHRVGGVLLVIAGVIGAMIGLGIALAGLVQPIAGLEPLTTGVLGGVVLMIGVVQVLGGRLAYQGRSWYGGMVAGLLGLAMLATAPLTLLGVVLIALGESQFDGAGTVFSYRTYRVGGVLLMIAGGVTAISGLALTTGPPIGFDLPVAVGTLGWLALVLGVIEVWGGWSAYAGRSWNAGIISGVLAVVTIITFPLGLLGLLLVALGEEAFDGRTRGRSSPVVDSAAIGTDTPEVGDEDHDRI